VREALVNVPIGTHPMSFDTGSLLTSLLVSSVGFVLLTYGRRMSRPPHLLAGLALLVYPYFVPGVLLMVIIAAVIIAGLWIAVRLGW
jgi:hypothetical protein